MTARPEGVIAVDESAITELSEIILVERDIVKMRETVGIDRWIDGRSRKDDDGGRRRGPTEWSMLMSQSLYLPVRHPSLANWSIVGLRMETQDLSEE